MACIARDRAHGDRFRLEKSIEHRKEQQEAWIDSRDYGRCTAMNASLLYPIQAMCFDPVRPQVRKGLQNRRDYM